ncbi:hypothetical protein ACKKBF_B20955 [Auxenochlorella protothecoides x Auxenochlorella symbiontica]
MNMGDLITSTYKGVSSQNGGRTWQVSLRYSLNGKKVRVRLGAHPSQEAAAHAYDRAYYRRSKTVEGVNLPEHMGPEVQDYLNRLTFEQVVEELQAIQVVTGASSFNNVDCQRNVFRATLRLSGAKQEQHCFPEELQAALHADLMLTLKFGRNARRNFTWEALSQIKAVDVQKLLMLHTAANSNVVDICRSLKQQVLEVSDDTLQFLASNRQKYPSSVWELPPHGSFSGLASSSPVSRLNESLAGALPAKQVVPCLPAPERTATPRSAVNLNESKGGLRADLSTDVQDQPDVVTPDVLSPTTILDLEFWNSQILVDDDISLDEFPSVAKDVQEGSENTSPAGVPYAFMERYNSTLIRLHGALSGTGGALQSCEEDDGVEDGTDVIDRFKQLRAWFFKEWPHFHDRLGSYEDPEEHDLYLMSMNKMRRIFDPNFTACYSDDDVEGMPDLESHTGMDVDGDHCDGMITSPESMDLGSDLAHQQRMMHILDNIRALEQGLEERGRALPASPCHGIRMPGDGGGGDVGDSLERVFPVPAGSVDEVLPEVLAMAKASAVEL